MCFEPIKEASFHHFLGKNVTICHKCYSSFSPKFLKFSIDGIRCLAVYKYDDTIQNYLYRFKGCFDYELKDVFLEYFSIYFKLKFWNYVVVPAPSYVEHDARRGFNHVVEMFDIFKNKICRCIIKKDDVKQSDFSKKDRINIINHLASINLKFLFNKNVLIVDDVFTTGSTIRAMVSLIKTAKPKKIKVLVMSKVE